jgi:hypothetical protein
MKLRGSFTILVFMICAISKAAIARQEQFVICKQSKHVRTIRSMTEDKQQGCVAYYSRDGQEKEVGQGKFNETCTKIVDNVRTNLEAANWTCKDVRHTSTTESGAVNDQSN